MQFEKALLENALPNTRAMNIDRKSLTRPLTALIAVAVLMLPALCHAQQTQDDRQKKAERLQKAMRFQPQQPGVDIDRPTDLKGFKLDAVKTSDDKTGWAVYNNRGQLIRKFMDINGDTSLDTMSYYKQGIEVYRDIDSNYNRKFDQHRWFGTAGSRWGIDRNEDGKIESWKRISAEEVSLEVVEAIKVALTNGDTSRFKTLMITADEVKRLGVGKEQEKEILERVQRANTEFAEFARSQSLIKKDTNWIHFSGLLPGIIPSGTNGSKTDVTIYDSVAAVVNNGRRSSGQLSIGTMIKIGDSWKVVDLPEPIVEGQALTNGGLFFRNSGNSVDAEIAGVTGEGGVSAEEQKLFAEYEEIYRKIQSASNNRVLQSLNAQRAELFEKLAISAEGESRTNWIIQMADQVTASYEQGEFDGGIKFMQEFIKNHEPKKDYTKSDMSYCKYRVINSFYNRKMRNTTTDELEEVQDQFMEKLEQFVKAHPRDPNSADAILQLALDDEAEGNINEAKDWYKNIITSFPNSALVKRAQGANTRLNSEGRQIRLTGRTLEGRNYSLADRKGKVVLIQYWATWCEPCKNDLRLIKEAYEEYGRRGFEVVGVSLDRDVNELKGFLRKNPLPWTQLFAEGGLDSPLSEQLGVAMVPTMILVGADGKVIDRSVLSQDIDRLLTRQFSRSAKRNER